MAGPDSLAVQGPGAQAQDRTWPQNWALSRCLQEDMLRCRSCGPQSTQQDVLDADGGLIFLTDEAIHATGHWQSHEESTITPRDRDVEPSAKRPDGESGAARASASAPVNSTLFDQVCAAGSLVAEPLKQVLRSVESRGSWGSSGSLAAGSAAARSASGNGSAPPGVALSGMAGHVSSRTSSKGGAAAYLEEIDLSQPREVRPGQGSDIAGAGVGAASPAQSSSRHPEPSEPNKPLKCPCLPPFPKDARALPDEEEMLAKTPWWCCFFCCCGLGCDHSALPSALCGCCYCVTASCETTPFKTNDGICMGLCECLCSTLQCQLPRLLETPPCLLCAFQRLGCELCGPSIWGSGKKSGPAHIDESVDEEAVYAPRTSPPGPVTATNEFLFDVAWCIYCCCAGCGVSDGSNGFLVACFNCSAKCFWCRMACEVHRPRRALGASNGDGALGCCLLLARCCALAAFCRLPPRARTPLCALCGRGVKQIRAVRGNSAPRQQEMR
mmetsp:Transcript_35349/g.77303  ORF Transcript_35349/g.77303 Transcript_35349/m.77303 type:complete len:498 (+) Transcript_35349:103-1596(+)